MRTGRASDRIIRQPAIGTARLLTKPTHGPKHNLGMLYFEGRGLAQDDQEAHKWFHLAAERGFVPAQLMLGRIYADGRGLPKDYTKALSWYRQAAERGHPEAQFMVGFIYEGVQGVARDKKQATSWYRRAAEQGHTLALASVERLLGPTNPVLAQTLNNLAGLYKTQGKLDEAEVLLLRVRKIVEGALGFEHPVVVGSLSNLAELYRTQGKYEQAESLFKRALDISEKISGPMQQQFIAGSLSNLADIYRAQGKYAQAEPLFKRAIGMWEESLGPEHPNLARTLNNMGVLYRELVEKDPEDPRLRVELGSALAGRGEWEAALEQYQEALRLSPTDSRTHYDIGLVHTWHGRSKQAIEHYRASLESDPDLKQAHFQLANELMRVKRHEEAVPYYAKVVELDPRNEFAHLMWAMALVGGGRYAAARVRLENSLGAFPGNGSLANALARVLAASPDDAVRDGTRALSMAEKIVKTNEQDLDLDYVVTLAMALAEVGQFDRGAQLQQAMISQAKDAGRQDLVDLLDDDLALYEQRKPARLPWKPDDPIFSPVPKKMAATDLLVDATPVEPAGGSR